ncbi:DUF1501 domain-containing protein [Schlesneria paludicola]|uniref:DUF1501 domain-containing protein n=1 Tax=Schlesneria paludicola TaxID=360056 RepID=UPI00029A2612|nr:DUF1501 domain-containing protein [Schlesneria paludicola]
MLSVLGRGATLCDGVSRREILRAGGLSLLGLGMPRWLAAKDGGGGNRSSRAKSVILFNLLGGPSHIDMFDLKPDAPVEIRGEFTGINTSVPGLSICELMPRLSQWMHKATLIRTFSHMFNSHDPLPIMTGFTDDKPSAQALPTDPPDIGAICQYLGMGPNDLPGAVCMPCFPGSGQKGHRRRGPYGGFLGKQYDPVFTLCKPTFEREPKFADYDPVMPIGQPFPPTADSLPEMSIQRLDGRKSLVAQIDRNFALAQSSRAIDTMSDAQRRAFLMLTSDRARDAFDLNLESNATRQAYGQNLVGSSLLIARRLVESGVPYISVHQEIFDHYGHAYDMHSNNFGMLKNLNLPLLDQVIPALLSDLDARGLLDSTLVVVMGEMGRTPKVNGTAGRDHWPQCGFSLLIGGGVQQGLVYGTTDKIGAYPTSNAVSPADLVATIYELMGINPHLTVPDRTGRPIEIAHGGEPIRAIIS